MRLKSYFAGTVESAICLARQEMGEDAMLVNSRRSTPETRHLGAYEVVFAASQDPVIEAAAARAASIARLPKAEAPASPTVQGLALEMAEMRRQLTRMTVQTSRPALRPHRAVHPALVGIEEALAVHEVSAGLSDSILESLGALELGVTVSEAQAAFREELHRRVGISGDVEFPAVIALVGPPGVGKTTMLAKLAIRYGIAAGRSTHLIAYDGHRIASSDQLRTYAAILGVGFEAVDSVHKLASALKESARKDLVLLDTPGYSAGDFDLSLELSQFLSTYPLVDTHLVLSCAAKSSDLFCMVERYNSFHPAKLVFTRLDETESFGGIVNEAARTGLSVSFLGTGPRVPDDLEPATGDRVAELLMGGREGFAVARA